MSRVGRMPITVPDEVKVDIKQAEVTVTGPKGQLRRRFSPDMSITRLVPLIRKSQASCLGDSKR